jgi:hypothetical protein
MLAAVSCYLFPSKLILKILHYQLTSSRQASNALWFTSTFPFFTHTQFHYVDSYATIALPAIAVATQGASAQQMLHAAVFSPIPSYPV